MPTSPADKRLCVRCRTWRDELEYEVILGRWVREDRLDVICRNCRNQDENWRRMNHE